MFGRVLMFLGLMSSCVATVYFASVLILFCRFVPKLGPWVQRAWGKSWCRALGIKVNVLHLDRFPAGGVVIAPNHESMFDIFVMASLPLPFRWISKEQVGKIPFVSGAMRALDAYFLKRDRSAGDLNVMKEVELGLEKGHSVIIFPEGTRTRTGELLPLKKGAFRTAQNAGALIVPVAIHGTFKIAPPGKLPLRWGHRVVVCIGKAFRIPRQDDIAPWMDHYRQELGQCLFDARTYLSS